MTYDISQERLDEFKKIFEKDYGKTYTDDEAREAANNLLSFFKIIMDMSEERYRWDKRLEQEPKGFAMEGNGRSCCICKESIRGDIWYDKNGLKCIDCQNAIEKKQIPKSVCKDNHSFYTSWELQNRLKVRYQTIAKMVREGKIIERVIKTKDGKGIHCRLYLFRDNPLIT